MEVVARVAGSLALFGAAAGLAYTGHWVFGVMFFWVGCAAWPKE